jgi:peptide/nickel transport system substrate-binding protein
MIRISRRSFLAGAVGAAGLAALRCGADGDEETTPTAATPTTGPVKRGGVYQLGSTFPALSIDPHTDITLGLVFTPFIYGYLLHEVQHLEGPPTLLFDHAESLEQPDQVTYIFKLHPGIQFQNLPPANGREVVAEDVLYSFDRIASVESTPFWKEGIESKSAPDPYTFEVLLTGPHAYTMAEFGGHRTAIVAKEAVEEFGDLKSHGLGSGPFQVESLSRGETMDMVRHPSYHVEGIPYVDGMSWRIIPDDSSLRAAFKAQQLDTYGPPTKIQADDVASFSGDIVLTRDPGLTIFTILLNELSLPALQDVRVREALEISVDRDAMIDKLAFGEGKVSGPVSWGLEFWSLAQEELRRRYERDVAKARQLLDAAGATDLALELKFAPGPATDQAAMIKQQLAEAGINIKLVSMELGSWYAARSSGDYQLMCRQRIPYPSEQYPLQFCHTKNWTRNQNPVHLPEPEIDALLDQILVTVDIAERRDLVLETTRKILDRHGPFFYLFSPYDYTARWDYVRGYEDVEPGMVLYTYDMWLDK